MNLASHVEGNNSMPPQGGGMFSGKGNYVGIGRIGMTKFDPSEGRDYELDAKPLTKA